jgi:hypothetical protein
MKSEADCTEDIQAKTWCATSNHDESYLHINGCHSERMWKYA